jgi:hypothetical protein
LLRRVPCGVWVIATAGDRSGREFAKFVG